VSGGDENGEEGMERTRGEGRGGREFVLCPGKKKKEKSVRMITVIA